MLCFPCVLWMNPLHDGRELMKDGLFWIYFLCLWLKSSASFSFSCFVFLRWFDFFFFFLFRHQQQLNVRRMHLILNTVLDYTYDIFVSVNVCVCMYVFVCCKAFNFLYIIALHSFDYYTSRLIGSEEEINFTIFIINIAGISCWVNKSIWNVCMCVCAIYDATDSDYHK